MVILPPAKPPRIIKFLKPYVLKMHFTNKYVTGQVIHSPTATVASSASSQEKDLRTSMESTRDVAAAAHIGKILGERLSGKDIPAVAIHLKREQKYHELDGGTPRSYGEESAEERPKVTRSITIVRPPGYQTGEGSPLVSPAASTPPVSPFSGGKESFRFRRRSVFEAYEKARGDAAGARSPRPSDDV